MADYSSFLFNSLSGAGDPFVANRTAAARAKQLSLENALAQQKYSAALMEDDRDYKFRVSEAARAQRNADRTFGLDQQRLAQTGTGPDGTPVYGLQPIYGKDADGNDVVLQLGKNGSAVRTALPDGVIPLGPGTTQAERSNAMYDAKSAAAARSALPGAEQSVSLARNAIDKIRGDAKGMSEQFGSILGVPQQYLPTIKGTERAKFQVDLAQASGQAFMQARQMLKGGGQITDFEGRKAESAYSRMQMAAEQGDQAQFLSALDDFDAAVTQGYEKLKAAGEGQYSRGPLTAAPAAQAAPAGDDIDALVNKYAR